jgi:uncharacterized protein YggE
MALLAGVGLLMVTPRGQGRDEAPAARRITTTGVGTVAVTPDTARISFAVGGSGKTMAAAVEACEAKAEKVGGVLREVRADGLTIKRGPLHLVGPVQAVLGGGQPVPIKPGVGPDVAVVPNIEVTRTFTVVLSDDKLDKLVRLADKVLTLAVEAGATETPTFNSPGNPALLGGLGGNTQANSRIELHRGDYAKLRAEATRLAVDDALANARAVAGSLKVTIKEIVTVTDQAANGVLGLGGINLPGTRGEVLGESEITITVSVTCSY